MTLSPEELDRIEGLVKRWETERADLGCMAEDGGPGLGAQVALVASLREDLSGELIEAAPSLLAEARRAKDLEGALREARWAIVNMASALTAAGAESTLTDPLPAIDAALSSTGVRG